MKGQNPGSLHKALGIMRHTIPSLENCLNMGQESDIWITAAESKLLPKLSQDSPLIVAICGGGSSGKSTLFNSVLKKEISPSGGTAGINRRILACANDSVFGMTGGFDTLFSHFESPPELMSNSVDLTTPGPPLYVKQSDFLPGLVLLDTPDFDTGSGGEYANRKAAELALKTSDVLIYIFTNSNYNNKDNTDFIAEMLTGIGSRKCFLVYRVYPSYSDEQVENHAETVAENIYGKDADKYVLGVFRADEDNDVAAGAVFMEPRPVGRFKERFQAHYSDFEGALRSVDIEQERVRLLSSILTDFCDNADDIIEKGKKSLVGLKIYLLSLRTAQTVWVREALKHFPMELVLKRFSEIWQTTDPTHVKIMRKTGAVLDLPVRAVMAGYRMVAGKGDDKSTVGKEIELRKRIDEDLINAANGLHVAAVARALNLSISKNDPAAKDLFALNKEVEKSSVDVGDGPFRMSPSEKGGLATFEAFVHPGVASEQEKLRNSDFKAVLNSILSKRDVVTSISKNVDQELEALALHMRREMGIRDKVRQTFSAFLQVLPATVAVTYVLSTGDPVGAAGIKVKLAGLFGVQDLYALIALPATTGMKNADLKQLEEMLGPVAETWLNNKLAAVNTLFEASITGGILNDAENRISKATQLLLELEKNVLKVKGTHGLH